MDDEVQCAVGGCLRAPAVRGLCRTHYMAKWRNGDLPVKPLEETMVRRRIGFSRADDKLLRRMAKATGRRYTALVRSAVREYLQRFIPPAQE